MADKVYSEIATRKGNCSYCNKGYMKGDKIDITVAWYDGIKLTSAYHHDCFDEMVSDTKYTGEEG